MTQLVVVGRTTDTTGVLKEDSLPLELFNVIPLALHATRLDQARAKLQVKADMSIVEIRPLGSFHP